MAAPMTSPESLSALANSGCMVKLRTLNRSTQRAQRTRSTRRGGQRLALMMRSVTRQDQCTILRASLRPVGRQTSMEGTDLRDWWIVKPIPTTYVRSQIQRARPERTTAKPGEGSTHRASAARSSRPTRQFGNRRDRGALPRGADARKEAPGLSGLTAVIHSGSPPSRASTETQVQPPLCPGQAMSRLSRKKQIRSWDSFSSERRRIARRGTRTWPGWRVHGWAGGDRRAPLLFGQGPKSGCLPSPRARTMDVCLPAQKCQTPNHDGAAPARNRIVNACGVRSRRSPITRLPRWHFRRPTS